MDVKLTPTLSGERIQVTAVGSIGIVRRPAPSHGLALDTGPDNAPVFLGEDDLRQALLALELRKKDPTLTVVGAILKAAAKRIRRRR